MMTTLAANCLMLLVHCFQITDNTQKAFICNLNFPEHFLPLQREQSNSKVLFISIRDETLDCWMRMKMEWFTTVQPEEKQCTMTKWPTPHYMGNLRNFVMFWPHSCFQSKSTILTIMKLENGMLDMNTGQLTNDL